MMSPGSRCAAVVPLVQRSSTQVRIVPRNLIWPFGLIRVVSQFTARSMVRSIVRFIGLDGASVPS